MAILGALFAFGSRFVGKILTTALGWASTLLFGRVPASRQYLLLGITFGSVIWLVLLLGILLPNVGTFLLAFVPGQDVIKEHIVRLVMLVGAIVVPGVVGGLTVLLTEPEARSPRRIVEGVARGYPLTALLAVLLIFLALLAVFRKARSLARGWTDAHVPLVVLPGRYDEVAADLERALRDAGLEVAPTAAPATMSKPARWLAAVAGTGGGALVPERMIQLDGTDLDILIYPMDVLVSGTPPLVARARAAMASRLTTTAAYQTVSAEAQAVEDRLARLSRPEAEAPRFDDDAVAAFTAIDEELATIEVPYEEWEVLYRARLQVERDLRAGAMAGEAVLGAATPGMPPSGIRGALAGAGRLALDGAEALLEAASDERTGQAIDRAAGPGWRWATRAASVVVAAAAALARTRDEIEDERAPGGDGDDVPDPAVAPG